MRTSAGDNLYKPRFEKVNLCGRIVQSLQVISVCMVTSLILAAFQIADMGVAAARSVDPAREPVDVSRQMGTPVEVVSGLSIPWSAAVSDNKVFVSQRESAELIVFEGGDRLRSIGRISNFLAVGDGGMLGLAILKDELANWIYAYHSTSSGNRIVRMSYTGGSLGEEQIVVDNIPGSRRHNGGRIAFGPDGMLYATVGDAGNPALAQNLDSLAGKILRMTPEGDIPYDNPFPNSRIYSFGHRNPQGLAWDSDGQLWATEFGDDTWDELNRIQPGGNYGWPMVEGRNGNSSFIDPVIQWRTQDMGPSGVAYIDGTLFIAGLTSQRIWTVTVDKAGRPTAMHHYTGQFGRIRDVFKGTDGGLWFMTNMRGGESGRIYSVQPTPEG